MGGSRWWGPVQSLPLAPYVGLPLRSSAKEMRVALAGQWLAVMAVALLLATQVPMWWKMPFAITALWAWSQFVHRAVEWAWGTDLASPVGWILFAGAFGLTLTGALLATLHGGQLTQDDASLAIGCAFLSACLPWLAWETLSPSRRRA